MNLLLISINKEKSLRPVLPIGMAIIATVCEEAGHNVRCVDLCFEVEDERVIKEASEEFQADMIGISIRNIDNQSFLDPVFYPPLARQVVNWCRIYFESKKIFLGGAGFTLVASEMMKYTKADYGIKGEGEFTVPQFLNILAAGGDVSVISGLIYFDSEGILRSNEMKERANLDTCKFPNRKFYDSRYFRYGYDTSTETLATVETIQTKRGCALSCIYCSNCNIEGKEVRKRSPKLVVDEMERMKDRAINSGLEIVDGVFNLPYDHSLEIVKEMKRRNLKLPWYCMLNPQAVTEELVALMKETGCVNVEFGTDSGNDQLLKVLNKNYTVKDIISAHNLVRSYDMKVEHCIFFGIPGETEKNVDETIDLMECLAPSTDWMTKVFCCLGFRVFPGIPLYDIGIKQGILSRDVNYTIPRFYCEPNIINNPNILDHIQDRVCQHKNWYLWWGLPNINLKDRVAYAKKQFIKMERLHQEFFSE